MVQLNYRDSRPIYVQIENGFIKLIENNILQPGDSLPPVIQLASKLAINPSTINKAYDNLLEKHYVYRDKEENYCVNSQEIIKYSRIDELLQEFDKLVNRLMKLSYSEDEIKHRIDLLQERKRSNDSGTGIS